MAKSKQEKEVNDDQELPVVDGVIEDVFVPGEDLMEDEELPNVIDVDPELIKAKVNSEELLAEVEYVKAAFANPVSRPIDEVNELVNKYNEFVEMGLI